jgi:hypothetical protein
MVLDSRREESNYLSGNFLSQLFFFCRVSYKAIVALLALSRVGAAG